MEVKIQRVRFRALPLLARRNEHPKRGVSEKASVGGAIVPNGVPVDVVVYGQVGVVVLGERRPHGRDVTAPVVRIAEKEATDTEVQPVQTGDAGLQPGILGLYGAADVFASSLSQT